jgi:Domain of unknown function (DUF5134)
MTSPAWLAGVLAAVVLVVAAFSAARLIAARGRRRRGEVDADGMHVVMGVAMAGMFVPRLATLPDAVWGAAFGVGAVWFAGRAWRDRGGRDPLAGRWCAYPVPHLVDCVAMVYVLWAVPVMAGGVGQPASGGAMGAAAAGARWPVIGLALAAGVCVYVVWLLDRLPASRAGSAAVATGPSAPPSAPRRSAGAAFHDHDRFSAGLSGQSVMIMRSGPALLAPRAATCCKIAMGVAMGVMLIDIL